MTDDSTEIVETTETAIQARGALDGKWISDLFAWAAAFVCAIATWQTRDNWWIGGLLVAATVLIVVSQWLGRRAARRASKLPPAKENAEAIRRELSELAKQLERRERRLTDRLTVFHQWLEFPEPVQLNPTEPSAAPEVDLEDARELFEKDRQLLKLIENETELLFNRILANEYMTDGSFDSKAATNDALRLVTKVARIYQPDVKEPLLETSLGLILRSASRASLQMLVVLERVPVDVKELSVQKLYGYVRTAVQAYGVYKKARPYFPWVTNALYVGRYALGANPLSLGAWYATGTLGQRLAKATTERLVNQQALQLIQAIVQLTAFEVAQAYSGDFRHRDPNWIYAAELTNLSAQLPASARTLSLAMGEIGALHLRSEYDRVWFYRCLAAGKPGGANPQTMALPSRDRLSVANRLERFVGTLPEGLGDAVGQWRREAEPRLNIKLGAVTYQGGEPAVQQALQSLGGFLLETKHVDEEDYLRLLEQTETAKLQPKLLQSFHENPPYLFQYPELAPHSEVANAYIADLVHLAATLPDRGPHVVFALEEVAAYLRIETEAIRSLWHKKLIEELQSTLGEQRLRGAPPESASAMALDLIASMDQVDAVFWPAKIHFKSDEDGREAVADDPTPLLMIVADGRVTAWSPGDLVPVWDARTSDVRSRRQRGVVGSYCHLCCEGQPTLVLEGAAWTRYQRHFEPLLKALKQP